MLVGRERERREIEQALARARLGTSATLALRGEAGIGKSALLDDAAQHASGMQLLRARGIESEAHIPFASLLELVRPALAALDQIPPAQAIALEGALALRPATAQDRFAIGAATLSLLSAYAEPQPVAVLIDDAQWLDAASAEALLFAFRRLVADPIAVLLAVRDGEPSLLDGADLPSLHVGGLTRAQSALLTPDLTAESAERLYAATAGNPLALLELATATDELAFAPEGAPVLVSTKVSQAFLRRAGGLDDAARRALVLAATSESGDMAMLERAAALLEIDTAALADAEAVGLISLGPGTLEFRHPLARSAIYADAPPELRREAHRALAHALPDRDVDRRAWHLSAAAVGIDEVASAALEQAGSRSRARSAYAPAMAAFERAARLTGEAETRAQRLLEAGEAAWLAGLAPRAVGLLDEARSFTTSPSRLVEIDHLAGHIAARQGPVMHGHAVLTMAAGRADPDRAVAMLAEAANACFYAGDPVEMLTTAQRAQSALTDDASVRSRFLASAALGMASVVGGDAAAGSRAIHEAILVAERSPELQEDLRILPWLAVAPIFLRESATGRSLLDDALGRARARAAVGALPFVLNLIARDQATTDGWALAEATYREAIGLSRESGQRTDLVFGLSGLAWLQARRGREPECRALANEALGLAAELGARLHEIWVLAALGELELGRGDAARAAEQFERQEALRAELGITDVDLCPGAELVDTYLRLDRVPDAQRLVTRFRALAEAKGQPWSLARALRAEALLADDGKFPSLFERALERHTATPDVFETARTRLAFGERLRRARNRVAAREQLRAALEVFESLDARPWSERARSELAASGETLRRRDPTTRDELTPQELQIALLLAAGKTTREAAAALFLSPKTIEYHLRHVYMKLDIHSRAELAEALAGGS